MYNKDHNNSVIQSFFKSLQFKNIYTNCKIHTKQEEVVPLENSL